MTVIWLRLRTLRDRESFNTILTGSWSLQCGNGQDDFDVILPSWSSTIHPLSVVQKLSILTQNKRVVKPGEKDKMMGGKEGGGKGQLSARHTEP